MIWYSWSSNQRFLKLYTLYVKIMRKVINGSVVACKYLLQIKKMKYLEKSKWVLDSTKKIPQSNIIRDFSCLYSHCKYDCVLYIVKTYGDMVANTIAFFIAGQFDYMTNTRFVFKQKYTKENFLKFWGMRNGTIFIDNGGM